MWLHRFAWLIAALTVLLPVTTGAVVTTLQAGMVFADWPSSDGHNMLAYPWWNSARDQFVEHGHRLAGMVIGLLSISLVIAAWLLDGRRQVRFVASLILVAVVAQGLLGGARVLLEKQVLALIHGDFAALVFSLMAVMILITSRGWDERTRLKSEAASQRVSSAARFLLVSLIAQYVMGGLDDSSLVCFVCAVCDLSFRLVHLRHGIRLSRKVCYQSRRADDRTIPDRIRNVVCQIRRPFVGRRCSTGFDATNRGLFITQGRRITDADDRCIDCNLLPSPKTIE